MARYREISSLRQYQIHHVPRRSRQAARACVALTLVTMVSGCAWFSHDAGMGVVANIAQYELNKDVAAVRTPDEAEAVRVAIRRLLGRTLTADTAVQIALLNNRGLQAAYTDLALAEAEMVEASLPPNPRISYLRKAGSGPELEVERAIVADILALVALPVRSEIARERFRQAQLRAALETLRLAAETRRAYYRAVAGQELVAFLAQAQLSAEAAAQLAVRLGETGSANKLDQAREQVFYADITAQLAVARQAVSSEREGLIRSLGLWDGDLKFKLPNALPALPRRAQSLAAIEVEAVRRRVDLQISRMELDALARAYGLTQATRFINILEAGYADKFERDKEGGRSLKRGFEIDLQIPIFDFGEVRVRQAEAVYMQAVNRLLELAVNVRSEARDAYRVYRSAYDIAGHYEREVLPLRKIISDETLLRYNAMQIDVFSLLAEARLRILATVAAIQAKRDFWLASADLKAAVAGGGRSGNRNEGTSSIAGSSGESGRH